MTHSNAPYVGPNAPIWPLGQGIRGIGCGFLIWVMLLVGLGLVVFSLSLVLGLTTMLEYHSGAVWIGVGLLSLGWPALYWKFGWFRTLLGYWPAPERGMGFGAECATCGSTVRRGRTLDDVFVCDTCATQRVRDTRRLIVPTVTMVGLTFIANGIASILNLRAHYATRQASAGISALDALGMVGSVGLTASGLIITYRVLRHLALAPIAPRHLLSARKQIVSSLHRAAAKDPYTPNG